MNYYTYKKALEKNRMLNGALQNKSALPEVTAPVAETKEEEKGIQIFQAPDNWKDGGGAADVVKTILGTAGDVVVGAFHGFGNYAEGIADAITYGVAAVEDIFDGESVEKRKGVVKVKDENGRWTWKTVEHEVYKEESSDQRRRIASENQIDKLFAPVDDFLDQYSVLGRSTDSAVEGVGQVVGMAYTAGLGRLAGLGKVGQAAIGLGAKATSSFGRSTSQAYQDGADPGEAELFGVISSAVDTATEAIFGGLGKGLNTLGLSHGLSSADDILAKKLTSKITSSFWRNAAQYGIKAGAEGLEEVAAEFGNAVAAGLTYKSEEDMLKLINDANYLESFVVGAMTSAFSQAPSLHSANKTGRDFITGRTQSEQTILDLEVERRVAAEEAKGVELDKKGRQAIEEAVANDMEKGLISTDFIEESLAGDSYRAYREAADLDTSELNEYNELAAIPENELSRNQRNRLDELESRIDDLRERRRARAARSHLDEELSPLIEGSRLSTSYRESALSRQKYTDDANNYKSESAKKTVQNLIDGKILNNSSAARGFASFLAKTSDDTGVEFDVTTTEKMRADGTAYVSNKTFTADGKTTVFDLESTEIDADFKPIVKIDGKEVDNYTFDIENGTITFDAAPEGGEISIDYRQLDVTTNGYKVGNKVVINLDSPKATKL